MRFMQDKDSSYLVDHAMKRSEEMIQAFNEQNFSNSEGGILLKLRSQRDPQYHQAYLQFQRNGNRDELVSTLKEIIKEFQD